MEKNFPTLYKTLSFLLAFEKNIRHIFSCLISDLNLVYFDSKWMGSIFKQIIKWFGDFRFIWDYSSFSRSNLFVNIIFLLEKK